ncbi:MAG: patatin-like phospholipase family protein [Anaerolineae bacterium]|nr:patatin-like phospholipase family protein [Caldilineales bacterium]MCX7852890.1 patatin-like phospholipase family protein [Caldilineales bacterium]MDW8269427.1 patatin-like phospholipase family protein [Anaerolineae bacterium]
MVPEHASLTAGSTSLPSKTALVLAGGGLTGAVYEIGALRAIDELLVGRDVRSFDIIVGTSAGALVGAMLAKGITPGEMLQILDGTHPLHRRSRIRPEHLFSLNAGELVRRSRRLPATIKNAIWHYVRHRSDMNLFDLIWSLVEVLPAGLYDNKALIQFVQENLKLRGLSDSFADTLAELYIIATDLDTGERVIFGRPPWDQVPLSLAIAASSAVPLLYRPVRIGDHEFVDGGLRGTASLDLAIEAGAKLIVCINPLVPIDNSNKQGIPLLGPDGRFLSDKGLQAVGSQALRIALQSGLAYHVKQLRRRHPDVDILLIEPRSDDYKMFFYNIMRYSARVIIAQHGFESVTLGLADRYHELKAMLQRHGFEITRRYVIEDLANIRESGYDLETMRSVLEDQPAPAAPAKRRTSTRETLQEAMASLDGAIARLDQHLR